MEEEPALCCGVGDGVGDSDGIKRKEWEQKGKLRFCFYGEKNGKLKKLGVLFLGEGNVKLRGEEAGAGYLLRQELEGGFGKISHLPSLASPSLIFYTTNHKTKNEILQKLTLTCELVYS